MGPLDAIWHLLNLFVPAAGVGLISAAAAKLFWRRELAGVRWHRLAAVCSLACAAAVLAGLVVFGRDGKMATYGLMVAAGALSMFWIGFGPGRR